jgi:hypothetical protein
MPDPHKDLAEIIEPDVLPAAAPTDIALPLLLACTVVLLLLAVWWLWRRRDPVRALRRLARSAEIEIAAAALARLMETRLVPDAWRQELDRLRFARPAPDAAAKLARLCQEAEEYVQARGGHS